MEAGDKIRCINTGGYNKLLTKGNVYTMLPGANPIGVRIIADDGREHGFYRSKFELAAVGLRMEDGAMEYEEAMAAQELIHGRG